MMNEKHILVIGAGSQDLIAALSLHKGIRGHEVDYVVVDDIEETSQSKPLQERIEMIFSTQGSIAKKVIQDLNNVKEAKQMSKVILDPIQDSICIVREASCVKTFGQSLQNKGKGKRRNGYKKRSW